MLVKSMGARLATYWLVFVAFFMLCQLLIARVAPDSFGIAVLMVAALPIAAVLTWGSRHDREGG